MFAGGEKIDVSQSSPFSFPNFIKPRHGRAARRPSRRRRLHQGLHALHQAGRVVDGKLMGLPYFAAIWVWNYYDDMLEKLKIDKPFTTYEEFIEHCVKAKKDGCQPLSRAVGRGRRPRAAARAPGTDDLEPRRHLLRQAGQPPARRRLGRARDAEVVGQHVREGPRHRRSRIAQGAVHDLGQGVRRRQEPLSRARTITTA